MTLGLPSRCINSTIFHERICHETHRISIQCVSYTDEPLHNPLVTKSVQICVIINRIADLYQVKNDIIVMRLYVTDILN